MAATFPTVACGTLQESLTLSQKVMACSFRWLAAYLTYLSALFSCQRTLDCICQSMKIHYLK